MTLASVHWGRHRIEFGLEFATLSAVAVTVRPDLTVSVRAPIGFSVEQVQAAVLRRAAWITRALRQFDQFHPLQPPRRYVPGETHRYLGSQLRLRVEAGEANSVVLQHGYLLVRLVGEPVADAIRPLVIGWFRERAQAIVGERLVACMKRPHVRDLTVPQWTLRDMPTLWGSCSRTGRLSFNPELVAAPVECIDYVVCHELCHLIERHHGPAFWGLLTDVMPDWRERREVLSAPATALPQT